MHVFYSLKQTKNAFAIGLGLVAANVVVLQSPSLRAGEITQNKGHYTVQGRVCAACGSFLPVVIRGLRAAICCAVLHGSLCVYVYIVLIYSAAKLQVCLQ